MRTGLRGRLRFRLTFSDVDAAQFFFADYYCRWMERALTELIAACGYSRAQSMRERRGFGARLHPARGGRPGHHEGLCGASGLQERRHGGGGRCLRST